MYWPVTAARLLNLPSPLDHEPITQLRQNRKGNFFASLSKSGLGVWDVRPTVLQAALVRSPRSLERWGTNQDVFWAHDGRGIFILTSTSHLLLYQLTPTTRTAYTHPPTSLFPSNGGPGEGDILMGWTLRSLGVAFIMGHPQSLFAQSHSLLITLRNPPSILTVPYPIPTQLVAPPNSHFPPPPLDGDGPEQEECEIWDLLKAKEWMQWETAPPIPLSIKVSRTQGTPALYTMVMDDGRVWGMHTVTRSENLPTSSPIAASPLASQQKGQAAASKFTGMPIYPPKARKEVSTSGLQALGLYDKEPEPVKPVENLDKAISATVNGKFGLAAVGTAGGLVQIISLPNFPSSPKASHSLDLKQSANLHTSPGSVTSMSWTSDGYALAVGYEHGWAVWSVSGRLCGWGLSLAETGSVDEGFMGGVLDIFWAPGNVELFALAHPPHQLYSIPFAKSATTGQHSPDNTRYAFLQMDDRVLVYRGADQPDMSVINPESDVWQHIKIPSDYMSINWPIRYASISTDGTLIAIAGRRGLTHYSTISGRWKLFADERQERDFVVRGGLLWFHHVLVAAIEVDKTYQIRLFSRDLDLSDVNILHSQMLPSPVLVMSLLDNSLLVYTADNTLYHFLIVPTKDTIKIHLCGSISFVGIVQVPSRVRALSWLIPEAQKRLGDPIDDLIVATIIFLIDGRLVLLRPRRAGNDEVRYDLQVLADRIESYWTHLHGIGTLENSLWGYDGKGMRVWLDALTIEATRLDVGKDAYETVTESVYLNLDFYPLSILMDKGIVIGVDYETSTRSLPFNLFKIQTGTHLFLPRFMRYHLSTSSTPLKRALIFAANYSPIIYFAHSLEILLHSVLEDDIDSAEDRAVEDQGKQLRDVIEFLDHFPEALDVVVGCARKTEVDRWERLFAVVGSPRELFERCLALGKLRTAASYLIVLQNLEELDDAKETIRLLRLAIDAKEFHLSKELLRFLHSIDESGSALRQAISEVGIISDVQVDAPAIEITRPLPDASSPDISSSSHTTPAIISPTPTTGTIPFPSSPDPALVASPDPNLARQVQIRNTERVNSPFQLESPRIYESPPSPRTVLVPGRTGSPLVIHGEGRLPDAPTVPDGEEMVGDVDDARG